MTDWVEQHSSHLLTRVRAAVPSLPAGPASVGRAILDDPAGVSRMTLRELAITTGTSDATVMRLVQAIGADGYRALRLGLAEAVGSMSSAAQADQVTTDIARDDLAPAVVASLRTQECEVVTETAACLDPDVLDEVADALASAHRVLVVGVGASGLVATDLSTKLERIGLWCRAATEVHDAVTIAVLLGPGDVVVVVSASGDTVDVLEPLDTAIEHGATTVALTCRPRSAVRRADHVLVSATGREQAVRPAAMSSRTGQLFVVDVVFTMVAQRRFDETKAAISASYDALRARHRGTSRRSATARPAGAHGTAAADTELPEADPVYAQTGPPGQGASEAKVPDDAVQEEIR